MRFGKVSQGFCTFLALSKLGLNNNCERFFENVQKSNRTLSFGFKLEIESQGFCTFLALSKLGLNNNCERFFENVQKSNRTLSFGFKLEIESLAELVAAQGVHTLLKMAQSKQNKSRRPPASSMPANGNKTPAPANNGVNKISAPRIELLQVRIMEKLEEISFFFRSYLKDT
jgi:hypothetical protein